MQVARNPHLPAATAVEVLTSKLMELKPKQKWITDAWGYRDAEPKQDISSVPKGKLLVFRKGLAFLSSGETLGSFSRTTERALDLLAEKAFGALGSLAVNSVKALREHTGLATEFARTLDHPDSFFLPVRNLVAARAETIGSLWKGKREYLIATTEDETGKQETFCLTPSVADMPEALMVLRLAAEKELLLYKLFDQEAGRTEIQQQLAQEWQQKYGERAREHTGEMADELIRRIEARLKEKGKTFEEIEARVWSMLDHFRAEPALAKRLPQ